MQTQATKQRAAADTLSDPRWAAVVARDRRSDGQFFYSVKTTGVYCRPSCGARLANPANVGFHLTTAGAEAAGFRACKRCKPDQLPLEVLHAAKVAEVCRVIEAAEEPPALAVLARGANLSPHHFHRLFKAVTGLTPKSYATAPRVKKVQAHLAKSNTVTEAILEAGFNSNSRFYEKSDAILGMTPTTFTEMAAPTPKYVSRSGRVRSAPSWLPPAPRASARFSWGTIQTPWFVTSAYRTGFPRPTC